MIITVKSSLDAFKLRQALWAMCYTPRAATDTTVTIPEGVNLTALGRELARYNMRLEWNQGDAATLIKEERRKEVA